MATKTFNTLKKNLKKDFSNLKKVKIAILGDSATQLLSVAIKGYGFETGLAYDVFEADYDQIERQIFDYDSELYDFNPDFVLIYFSAQKLLKKFGKLDFKGRLSFSDDHINHITNVYKSLTGRLKSKVIFFNFEEINDSVFGNFACKTETSFLYQIRKINYELMKLTHRFKNLFILDLSSLITSFGRNFSYDSKMYYGSQMPLSLDILPEVAKNFTDVVSAINGTFKKCVILDLDNTLWGGIIGDDGLENIQIGELGIGKAFTDLQMWLKQLVKRGIILGVCSKNDENNAKEPFEKHPDMVLRLDDISVFVANWENKADNIKYIQSVLNIGFDSMVFLDDNPFERNIVKTHIPDITVPDLPEDPTEYLGYLWSQNLFETASFTEADEQRTKQYQEEANRAIAQQKFVNEDEFLSSLGMKSVVKPFDKFTIPRVAQLTQRSNQFNLRTIRYTEEEISKLANSTEYLTLSFSLEDKFGDYGLISASILKKIESALFIDTWIMSCRVLKRGMEKFVLNQIIRLAVKNGFNCIEGEYIPTAKNSMVKNHFEGLGFVHVKSEKNLWELRLENLKEFKTFIEEK